MPETTQTPKTRAGDINHIEFASTDANATTAFMGALFGYAFHDMGTPDAPYLTFNQDGRGGAVRPIMEGEPGPGTTAYIGVDDLDAATTKATQHGAKVIVPKQPVPGMGWFTWLHVPGDVVVAIWQDDLDAA